MIRPLVPLAIAAILVLSGPALAAGPDTTRVRLGPDGPAAFVAWPAGDGPAPAVIVVHEWWGLNPQIREVARRLSRQGYVAIVPDLYRGRVASDPEAAHVLARSVEEERAVEILAAAAGWLRGESRTARSRIGVIGFCMGGALAQSFALASDAPAAVVVFYGTPETRGARLAALRAPLQGHFGAADDGIPRERVRAFQDALGAAGKSHEVHLYAGAGHAFMHEGRPSHNADASRLAWARLLAFLHKHVKS